MHGTTGYVDHARNIGLITPATGNEGDVYLGMSCTPYMLCEDTVIPGKIIHETCRLIGSVELRWPEDSTTQSIKEFGEAVAGIIA